MRQGGASRDRTASWEEEAGDQIHPQCLGVPICEVGWLQSLSAVLVRQHVHSVWYTPKGQRGK